MVLIRDVVSCDTIAISAIALKLQHAALGRMDSTNWLFQTDRRNFKYDPAVRSRLLCYTASTKSHKRLSERCHMAPGARNGNPCDPTVTE